MDLVLRKIKEMPQYLRKGAIEDAVKSFIVDSRVVGVNIGGMYDQTLKSIAQSIMFDTSNKQQFWMADDGTDVMAYALAHITVDLDDQFTYIIAQAWVHPKIRGQKYTKIWWKQLQEEAERSFCKHIMLPASRKVAPYIRFLGKGFTEYATLLKKDI